MGESEEVTMMDAREPFHCEQAAVEVTQSACWSNHGNQLSR